MLTPDQNKKHTILITGASGLIGPKLIRNLLEKGHSVSVLSRNPHKIKGVQVFKWDIDNQTIDNDSLNGVDTIIHLAGAGIADERWTKARKQLIIDSRVLSTQLLYRAIEETKAPIKTIISASAVGFYGDRADEILTESSSNGTGFLADCCRQWENAVDEGQKFGVRLVKFRIGLVLAKQGGALAKLETPVSLFLGAPLGSGKQWMPWIHVKDLLALFEKAIENPIFEGTFNACSPIPVTNFEFTKILAKTLFRPVWPIKVPKFVLKAVLGEMSQVILISNHTSSQKLINTGFKFRYAGLDEALKEIYSH
jgi:uncharacterized protein (TIGR01777 family)